MSLIAKQSLSCFDKKYDAFANRAPIGFVHVCDSAEELTAATAAVFTTTTTAAAAAWGLKTTPGSSLASPVHNTNTHMQTQPLRKVS